VEHPLAIISKAFGASLILLGGAAAANAACPADAINVRPGINLAKLVEQSPKGAGFCLLPGEHRMQSIQPKDNQRFYGKGEAILNGSRLITAFTREGKFWVANHQTQQGLRHAGDECLSNRPICDHPEAFYINDRPLYAVAHKENVTRGKFFFDYDANKIYFLDDPKGKKIEASVSPYAFVGNDSKGVLIQDLIVEKYSSPLQHGAIGYSNPGEGWIIRRNIVRLNYGAGITVKSNSKVLNNYIHGNGQLGIGCNGDDIVIQGNRIARNGFFAGLEPLWEGGGGKCALTRRLIFRDNYSHHNNAFGFWTDIDNIDTLYENNRIEYNRHGGISHEISYKAVIRNNTFKANGYGFAVWLWGPAILIQNSRDVEVYGNTVDQTGGYSGISLIQQDRGSGAYGEHETRDNFVHHNRIINKELNSGAVGAIADHDPSAMRAGNNRFNFNTYIVRSASEESWAWVDGFYDWATYRRKSGQDEQSNIVIDR
jgi:parallel beta-helix repeat protein